MRHSEPRVSPRPIKRISDSADEFAGPSAALPREHFDTDLAAPGPPFTDFAGEWQYSTAGGLGRHTLCRIIEEQIGKTTGLRKLLRGDEGTRRWRDERT